MSSEPHNRPVENKNLKTTGRFSTKLSALTNYPGIRLTSSKALISSTIDRDKTEILLNTTISTPTTVRQDTVLNKGTVQNTITPLRSSNLMTRKASKAPSRLNSITGISVTSRRSSVNKLSTDSSKLLININELCSPWYVDSNDFTTVISLDCVRVLLPLNIRSVL